MAPGPAPDPDALRRDRANDGATWTTLPATGRAGPTPVWPLIEPTDRELVLWERTWSRPQALVWERNRQEFEVAMYVRCLAKAEQAGAPVTARRLVVRQQNSLGISLAGMLRWRWRIADDQGGFPEAIPTRTGEVTNGARRDVICNA